MKGTAQQRLSSGAKRRAKSAMQRHCLVGLSDIGALLEDAAPAVPLVAGAGAGGRAGGRRDAEAGAEFVGGRGVPSSCVADWAGGGAAGGAADGSAFMMLTGGIDCEDGNVTFGPGGFSAALPGVGPAGWLLDASGRVRVGQL